MGTEHFLSTCAIAALLNFCFSTIAAQGGGPVQIPLTRFTCQGRASGYYADVETGCQVYHMCDGLGRQFSYSCPNTTLFQQRMLICDHWYMVNCSKSESDYDANLLIGQRDKPFVSDADMQLRTPRPDILSVPPNNNYYDGLREAESKFSVHPGNSIVGVADSISSADNNGLDSAKQNYRPPSTWSTGVGANGQQTARPNGNYNVNIDHNADYELTHDNLAGAASQGPTPTFQPTPENKFIQEPGSSIPPPSQDLSPPLPPITTTESDDFDIDIRMKDSGEDSVYNFIKRFDPNSPDSHKTSMTKTEIIDINQHLPSGQVSSEDERAPRKFKSAVKNFNTVQSGKNKAFTDDTRFNTVNIKPANPTESTFSETDRSYNQASGLETDLLPPKKDYSEQPSTTMGPPVYFDWKWAVPAFDLEPPKLSNDTNSTIAPQRRAAGKSPFSDVTRPTPRETDPVPKNTEYNISSYFVPDYVFPLDNPHPGYDNEDAQTSFQVKVGRPGRSSYGENPDCPHCHPAYLKPGTCEPCIVKR